MDEIANNTYTIMHSITYPLGIGVGFAVVTIVVFVAVGTVLFSKPTVGVPVFYSLLHKMYEGTF